MAALRRQWPGRLTKLRVRAIQTALMRRRLRARVVAGESLPASVAWTNSGPSNSRSRLCGSSAPAAQAQCSLLCWHVALRHTALLSPCYSFWLPLPCSARICTLTATATSAKMGLFMHVTERSTPCMLCGCVCVRQAIELLFGGSLRMHHSRLRCDFIDRKSQQPTQRCCSGFWEDNTRSLERISSSWPSATSQSCASELQPYIGVVIAWCKPCAGTEGTRAPLFLPGCRSIVDELAWRTAYFSASMTRWDARARVRAMRHTMRWYCIGNAFPGSNYFTASMTR